MEEIAGRDGYRQGTTTGAGSSTTAVDTVLADKPDDYYSLYYLLLTSGTYSGSIRPLSDFTQTGGVMTWLAALAGASGTAVTYELCLFHPSDVLRALNEASFEGYPYVKRRIRDVNLLISGNWLNDGGFEDWTSATALREWAAVGTATFAKRTTIYASRLWGKTAVMVTSVAANDGIKQSTANNAALADLRGNSVTFRAQVAGTSGDVVIRITDDDGTTSSSALTGAATWELLEVTRTISSSTKVVTFDIISPGNQAFYVDNARVIGPAIYKYKLPFFVVDVAELSLQSNANETWMCDDVDEAYPFSQISTYDYVYNNTDRILYIPRSLPQERKIKIIGGGYLSTLSADTDTVELDGDELRPYIALAAHKLYQSQAGLAAASEDKTRFRQEAAEWYQEYEKRRMTHSRTQPVRIPYY